MSVTPTKVSRSQKHIVWYYGLVAPSVMIQSRETEKIICELKPRREEHYQTPCFTNDLFHLYFVVGNKDPDHLGRFSVVEL
jgi:hypothetical protein